VKVVGARLGKDLDERAALAAFVSGEDIRADLHLRDRVRFWSNVGDAVSRVTVNAGTVHLILVRLLPLAGADDLEARFRIEAVGALRP
jgi:hypothetical protein